MRKISFSANAFIWRWFLIALGAFIAAYLVEGIHYKSVPALCLAILLLSFLNVIFKPLLVLFALPFIVLTLGVGVWFINAFFFILVSKFVDGFVVETFGDALLGAVILSIVSLLANAIFRRSSNSELGKNKNKKPKGGREEDDVIDI